MTTGPTSLAELLRENLKEFKAPKGYVELKGRLSATKPTRRPPTVKVSPENIRELGSATSKDD
jgi:hypothetical protein